MRRTAAKESLTIFKPMVITLIVLLVSVLNSVSAETETTDGVEVKETWTYSKEMKAIIGGVLGFWGGVGSMGTLFLVILMTQKYCCRNNQHKDDNT